MTDIERDGTSIAGAVTEALQGDEELKTWFCQCWPCLKKLLELIAARVPRLKAILDLVIKAGDQVHAKICPD